MAQKLSEIADLYCISKTVPPQIGDIALHRTATKMMIISAENLSEVAFKSVTVYIAIHPKTVTSEQMLAYLQSDKGQAEIKKQLTPTLNITKVGLINVEI